ncbi:MAG: cobalt ECF transporter T component CbiQ, partial [Deltaproteobacteria bacterium]|nr:cobalt ECF transporter T component CbiQ [Deltaproteobacteria bacterium]
MIQETFSEGASPLHSLAPRTRTLAAIMLSLVVALSHELLALVMALIIAILLIRTARLNLLKAGRRLLVIGGFLLLIWLILPLTGGGTIVWQYSFISISQTGLNLALQLTLKTCAMLLIFLALISTMSTADLAHALHSLKLPAKLILLLLITYRYIFLIEDELQTMLRAAKIRNFQPGTSLHCDKTYANLLGMLFVRAAERAQRVHKAMLCRAFDGHFHNLKEYPNRPFDYYFLLLISILSIFVILGE